VDFSRVKLSDDDETFLQEVRTTLSTLVTDEVRQRDRASGDNFDEEVHLALGTRGYLEREWKTEADGGFDTVRRRLWKLETRRAGLPSFTWGITAMVARAVERFGSAALKEEVLPGVLSGHTRLCLGLTEPEGGSDVATCKTKAVRDGESWIINGSKMFTTGAHNCRYVFLTTNTDPSASKHKSLTMFMVPLASVGVDIQGIRTVDGDRTNIVYYGDVRVEDRYRLGEVNGGWTVLRSALDAEHGVVESANVGLDDLSAMSEHSCLTAVAVDQVAAATAVPDRNGFRRLDDDAVKYRLGRSFARVEATLSTTGAFGRVAIAENMRIVAEDLMDILGAAGSLPVEVTGAVDRGAEYLFRLAGPTGIYGGTVEVFRNMIAQHTLGLGRQG
jgi:alkylation response protein AidB-like acyl-CoA dehydrogenase